ncbi:MAG: hypothetical protein IIA89_02760 [Chloroflexi bacterium]|nr:hypothetical protein [Chloroflexota bacterium]
MENVKASAYVKLGTSLRYLIDVKEGERIGGKYVLANIESVLTLIEQLGFHNTKAAAGVRQLMELRGELTRVGADQTRIDEEQANRLDTIGRKIRDQLLSEGEGIEVHSGSSEAIRDQTVWRLRWALTIYTIPLVLFAAEATSRFTSLDLLRSLIIAGAVFVISGGTIWDRREIRRPAVWLTFFGLLAAVLLSQ